MHSTVAPAAHDTPSRPVWNTYIAVTSADETAARVTQAGGRILSAPMDIVDAGRMAVFADPGGAVFNVWQAAQHKGAQLVNQANTWNWSDLNTRDLEDARACHRPLVAAPAVAHAMQRFSPIPRAPSSP
jgi:hypothetical protein